MCSCPRSLRRRLAGRAERAFAICGVFFLLFHAGFSVSEITSESMEPTLQGTAGEPDNDWILYETISTRFAPPPRDKLIVFTAEDGLRVAKRVVGFPGERLRIVDGALEVDGVRRELGDGARYLRAGRLRPRRDIDGTCEVAPDSVFVLGDNSKDSWDSRFFGDLERTAGEGRVVGEVWPPSRWSWLW